MAKQDRSRSDIVGVETSGNASMESVSQNELAPPNGALSTMVRTRRSWAALRQFDARFYVAGFAVFAIAAVWGMIAIQLLSERELEIQNAINANENLARTIEEDVSRTVRSVDEGLLVLGEEYLRRGEKIDIPALRRQGILASPLLNQVSIIGPDGYLLASSLPYKRVYLGDRDGVRAHLDHDGGKLYIEKPRPGDSSGKWSIDLTRRINRPDGSLAAIALLAIDPAYFAVFFSSIRMGGNGFIGIVGRDGTVRARYWESANASEIGQDLSGTRLFTRLAEADHGSYLDDGVQADSRDISARDGISRILSYRALKDYPLLVRVGVAQSDVLAAFYSRRLWYCVGAGMFTVVTLIFAWLLILSMTKRARVSAELRLNEMRLRELAAHHETIRESERARLARELHDELGQLLTAAKLHLSLPHAEAADRRPGRNHLIQIVEQAIGITRNVVMDLRPPVLDQGFAAAVRWHAAQFFERTNIQCEVDIQEGPFALDTGFKVPLYRIVQESLTNVAKHAGATRVAIRLTGHGGRCRLQISDNGKGFQHENATDKRTFGLLGMRERMAMLGGELTVTSAPGEGTVVTVHVAQERRAA